MPAWLRTGTGGMSSHWHINNILQQSRNAALCQLDKPLSGQHRGERAQTSLYYHRCLLAYTHTWMLNGMLMAAGPSSLIVV